MPTYEYKCEACGHAFEKFHSITAAPIKKCPKCGKLKVKRLIGTGAGLIFKGGGFYITDYRSDSYKNAAKSDAPPATATADAKAGGDGKSAAPSDSKSSESKPAAESKPTGESAPAPAPKSEKPAGDSKPRKSSGASKS